MVNEANVDEPSDSVTALPAETEPEPLTYDWVDVLLDEGNVLLPPMPSTVPPVIYKE